LKIVKKLTKDGGAILFIFEQYCPYFRKNWFIGKDFFGVVFWVF